MLCDENRMVPHRGLLAVVRRVGGGESLLDEPLAMLEDGFEPFLLQIAPLGGTEPETATKSGTSQPVEEFIQVPFQASVPFSQ
jgi:hypothetical protein